MKTIKVVAAIIKKDNKIMIAKRLSGDLAGKWEFPGGKIEKGETAEIALEREIMEEMELSVNIDKYFMTAEYDYPTFHLSMDCFICSLNSHKITLHDHSDYKWIIINDDLINIDWCPADTQIAKKIRDTFS